MHPDTEQPPRRDRVAELFAAALDGDRLARTHLAQLAGRDALAGRALAALPAADSAPTSGGAGPAPWAVAYVDQLHARAADPHRR